MPDATPEARTIKPGHMQGSRFVMLQLGLLVLFAIGLFFILRAFVRHIQHERPVEQPLQWAQRAAWTPFPLVPHEVEHDMLSAAESGMAYRKELFTLDPDPAVEQALETDLLALASLARDTAHFDSEDGRREIQAIADRWPGQFYPAWLLAAWQARHDDWGAFDRQMRLAIPLADRVFTEGGHAPHTLTDTFAIAFDRIRQVPRQGLKRPERTIDQQLILVYPTPPSDERGVVVLPVFRDFYRFANPAIEGAQPGKDWFALPQGRIGGLDHPASNLPSRKAVARPPPPRHY